MKVKLVHDYTKYNDKLEKGIIGSACETPEEQKLRSNEDNFVKVKFEGVTEVDVLWRGLEIIDEDYLAKKQAEKEVYFESMRTARNVKLTLGPKEGFRSLELVYNDTIKGETEVVVTDKKEAEDYFKAFEKYNIEYETTILEGKRKSNKE